MNKYIYFNAVAICLVITSIVKSQPATPNPSDFSKMTEVLPPSPNAASLGKYGGIDLSLASGMANINIPLYQYNSINVQTPISLSYTSNGFRVDELPGRVGTGWSLNAGGVITRTVYGYTDELAVKLSPPANFPPTISRALIDSLEGFVLNNSDAQPDLFTFNFNGYTGKFILDRNLNPILLSHSSLKIERVSVSKFIDSCDFKITTADGVKYFFGGSNFTERTKKTTTGSGCGRNFLYPIETAWYLKKIVHPNNDSITFTYTPIRMSYTTSISESVYARVNNIAPTCLGSSVSIIPLDDASCENILQVNGFLLQEINSVAGNKVKLTYKNRKDCGDKLLSSIEIYQPNQVTPYKIFNLNYNDAHANSCINSYSKSDTSLTYRPFLTEIIEKTLDNVLTKKHVFAYNDINGLPPRLSYAQDHYGYFNGEPNSTLIPVPSSPLYPSAPWKAALSTATANRGVDPIYCQKGLLSAITYPTGGKDTILYEANQVYKKVTTYPPKVFIQVGADNPTGIFKTTAYSDSAIISFSQEVKIFGGCFSYSATGGDLIRDRTAITLLRNGTTVFTTTIRPDEDLNQNLSLTPGIYQMKVTTTGEEVSGGFILYYQSGVITSKDTNVNIGGLRVAKTISYDSISNNATIKKYLYGTLSTPNISSAHNTFTNPEYQTILSVYEPCGCEVIPVNYYSCYSNTLNNIYALPASPVSYETVIESFGDNFENGGIEHRFTVCEDQAACRLLGNEALLSTRLLSSYAWKNAQEIYQHTFKKRGADFIPVKKVFTHYKEDSRVDQEIKAYAVNKKYEAPCKGAVYLTDLELNAWDMVTYSHFQKWVYPDTIRTWTYDDNGRNYVEQVAITEYANAAHALPTKQTTFSSKGIKTKLTTLYPQDTTLSGTEEVVRKALISKNMIGNILQQKMNSGDSLLYTLKTGYATYPNGLILPQTHTVSINNKPTEERNRFYTYNNYGKIIEQSKTGDVHKVYIWGYKNQYPVAEIIGSTDSIVSKLINQTIVDNPTSDQQLRDELHKIRTGLATSKVLVTTYTYNPGIGITSQTDPNNKTIYYEYDQLGRLKRIKDQNKNVIKTFDYQYQK